MRAAVAFRGRVVGLLLLAGLAPLAGCAADADEVETKSAALTVPVPAVTQYVVMASRSASFNDRTHVIGGDLGVAPSGTATPNTLIAGFDTRVGVGEVLLAQSMTLRDRAVVGEVGVNQLSAPFATTGPRSAYEAPPAQPVPGPIAPGTAPVTVSSGQTLTLQPGAYGAVTVNGVLNLAGGLYQFQSLFLNNDARLIAVGASTVRVAGVLTALDRARLLPAAPQQAGALRLIVGGATNALVLSNDVQLTALVVARGDFRAGDRLIAAGAVAARDVIIGHDGRLTFNAGFGCGSNASCDEGNSCTNDVCQDARCVRTNAPNGTACSDSNGCTQTDTCQAGACVGGNPVVCAPSDQCHAAGTCNPATGTCSNPARPDGTACGDGNACTQTDTCQAGTCVGGNPVVCTASDQCHVAGTCNPASGTCSNPPAEDGTPCADDNACTQVDACLAGACVGGDPVICTPSDQCRAAGTCDPGTGVCSDPPAGDGTPCADGNACTQADVCLAGACVGGNPVVCTPSDPCHDAGVCNPASGVCSNPPAEDGRTCADGNACTQIDACVGGVCVGSGPVVCTASDQCHDAGVCDPGSGVCSDPARPDGTTCSDGDVCTQGESCQAGVCTGGTPDPDGGTCGGDTLSMAVRLPMTHLAATLMPAQVAIYGAATTGTSIFLDGVNVFEGVSTTNWASVANAGSGQIVLNSTPIAPVDTGDIWSIGNVDLPAGSTALVVHGDLRTSGIADEVAGQVSGAVIEAASIALGTTTITATFPTPAPADITHGTNSVLTLAPGAYGNVVFNLGTLQLSPGTYMFESLTMNAGSALVANNATGVVRVNVRTQMIFRASAAAAINTANLRFAVFGPGGATLGPDLSPTNVFRGTVVAVNGPVLIEGTRTYRGAFFGQTVIVSTGATIQHLPFSAWEPPS